jgi:peptide/nickel transport system substrate-binding protein
MTHKKSTLHPFLIILAVAMVSVLFAVACGGGATSTAVPNIGATQAAETAATEAAAAEAAAAAAAAAEQAKYGGSITMAFPADHSTLDPAFALPSIETYLLENVYDPLLRIEVDGSYSPALATSWEPNDDLSSYTFHLRKGVTFRHGKEFKAEDVLFTMNRHLDPELDTPHHGLISGTVVQIVAVDDYTVRFDLKGPNGFFLDILTMFSTHILPADVDLDRLILEEFGTGPFILDEWLPGERATLVRNPDYWEEGRPYLDEMIFMGMSETVTQTSALKTGDVDWVSMLEPQSVPEIEAHPETKVFSVASSGNIGLTMDNSQPPFDNKLVRKAFQAATNRDLINQAALLGQGTIANDHPIPSSDPRFAPQYAPPEYDPELAKSLLEQAGYPDGIDVTLHTGDVGLGMIELAVAFKESAGPAGIRVEIKKHPADAFWSEVFMQYPFVIIFWGPRPNPDNILTQAFHSGSGWNANRYYNDTLDALIERARGETQEQQKETYGEIQRILVDDVPGIIIANPLLSIGARNHVQDAGPHPTRSKTMRNAWLEK